MGRVHCWRVMMTTLKPFHQLQAFITILSSLPLNVLVPLFLYKFKKKEKKKKNLEEEGVGVHCQVPVLHQTLLQLKIANILSIL